MHLYFCSYSVIKLPTFLKQSKRSIIIMVFLTFYNHLLLLMLKRFVLYFVLTFHHVYKYTLIWFCICILTAYWNSIQPWHVSLIFSFPQWWWGSYYKYYFYQSHLNIYWILYKTLKYLKMHRTIFNSFLIYSWLQVMLQILMYFLEQNKKWMPFYLEDGYQ